MSGRRGLPTVAVILLAGAVFGLAHLYQGRLGVLTTGILGAVLTLLYLVTASLVLPIILHVLIDLRALLIRVENNGDDTNRPMNE